MSDARPAPRLPAGAGALAGLPALPVTACESALTELLAARAGDLAREARRVVRAYELAPADRATALDAVAAVQRALLLDVVAGRTSIDPRTWTLSVRGESARAVRRAAAQGAITVAPHRQRLATQRAALLAVRENASVGVPVETGTEQPVADVPVRTELSATAASPFESTTATGRAPRSATGPLGPARHARSPVGATPGRRLTARRSARWGAAALLSSVTIMVGAAVAPAEERPADAPGTSNVSFVDRLTMPIIGLWETLVPGSKDQDPADVSPTPDPPAPAVPVPSVPTPEPTPTPTPDPTVPDAAVVPVVPTTPIVPDVPDAPVAPVVPAPGTGSGGSWTTPGDGRPGNSGGRHDHDTGRGEKHEHDERRGDDDDDDWRGWGRDKDRDTGRDDGRQSKGRGNDRDDDRRDGKQDGRDQDRRTNANTDKARSRGRSRASHASDREEPSPRV